MDLMFYQQMSFLSEVGLMQIMANHETLSIVWCVGIYVDVSSMIMFLDM